jgi:competence protein ComEA
MRVCSKCHSPNILAANPRDRQAWEDTITKMAGMGAEATDDEFTTILTYLSKNVAPKPVPPSLNINQASALELETSLALSPDAAYSILAYRTRHGGFQSVGELKQVPGLGAKFAEVAKGRVTF